VIRDKWYVVRKTTTVLIIVLTTYHVSRTTAYADTGFLAQQAQLAWQDRDKPGQTEAAIQLWRQAAKAEPNNVDLWINLSKAQGRAVRHAKTTEERQKWADEARASAEQAVKISPNRSDALTAYGESLGQWANAHKGIHSLSTVHHAVDALRKAISLNPKNAYAHMLLAEFYRQAPRHISIGDKTKALEQARLAVEYGPEYTIDHLVLARALLDLDKKDEAIAVLQKTLALTAPASVIPETRADQETAANMLTSLGIVPAHPLDHSASSGTPQCGEAAGVCTEK
jgi:tetratricopeptide (TPR) repeat protein